MNNIFKKIAATTVFVALNLAVVEANPTTAITFSLSANLIDQDRGDFLGSYVGGFTGEDTNNDSVLALSELTDFTFGQEVFDNGDQLIFGLTDLVQFTYDLKELQLNLLAIKFFDFSCLVGADVRLGLTSSRGGIGSSACGDASAVFTSVQVAELPSEPPMSVPEPRSIIALSLLGIGGLLKKIMSSYST